MKGYYRFPSIHNNKIVFVSEDDLWITSIDNPKAIRLTNNNSEVSSPIFSPNGKHIAYIGTEDGGTEIYIIPTNGGISKRLTYDGSFISQISLWKDKQIFYSSTLSSTIGRVLDLRLVNSNGGESKALNFGMARSISISESGRVIGKNTADPARWKRYKGGTAGEILIDKNDNKFRKLLNLKSNIANPFWIKNRVYFISDHEGIGNIYSCNKKGSNITKHTNHNNYYARNANTDGKNIVYHAGADIYFLKCDTNISEKIEINFTSSKIQTSRKFTNVQKHLESASLSNDKNFISIISRGKSFVMGNWDGPAFQYGKKHGIRYKHPIFLNQDKKLLIVSDNENTERIEFHTLKSKSIKKSTLDFGRILSVKKAPSKDLFTIINHKHEIFLYDSSKDKKTKIDHSKHDFIDCNWSPDSKYIVYNCSINSRCTIIKIYDIKNKKTHLITKPVNKDFSPVFDSSGKYLAFISIRSFKPTYDSIQFDLSFQKAEKPYIITLNKDTMSPFTKNPNDEHKAKDKSVKKSKNEKKLDISIDFDGISDRIMEIPIKENRLSDNFDFKDNKIFYIVNETDESTDGTLKYYDLKEFEEKVFMQNVSNFHIYDDKILVIDKLNNLKFLPFSTPPSKEILSNTKFNSKSGSINLNRIKLEINPTDEWKQMYSEAWRLQRDYFWVSNMSGINWKKIFDRYYSLIDRIGSRSEFSDLIWEMQGELGTSHCYEMGGDYKQRRNYHQGNLGATLKYNEKFNAYKIVNIFKGDFWENTKSPLLNPGLNINKGNYIRKINGNKLSNKITPGHLLVNLSNSEVDIEVLNSKFKKPRNLTIKTISNQMHLQYRDWVEKNKEYVHKKSNNKIGYLHIPDMGPFGFAEFHRHFLSEITYDGLIVDVRYNGGGHVSQLLLSKLARKRLGFDLTRWMGEEPYPVESPAGPMVAITNEFAGSDGDIFSHSWKMMGLGKLIGKRTWGGVIGIWPRNSLVDGTMTTQPEFSFWFKDVGWGVENYGAEVDIEVDNLPQDCMNNIDNQLNKAISIVKKDLTKKGAVLKPDFSNKPNLKLP